MRGAMSRKWEHWIRVTHMQYLSAFTCYVKGHACFSFTLSTLSGFLAHFYRHIAVAMPV